VATPPDPAETAPATTGPGLLRRMLNAIFEAAKDGKALIAGAVTSVAVSVAALATGYDGFVGEALGTLEAWLLFALNALFTVVLIVLLTAWLKPERKLAYAIVVAIGFQALIATDLEVQPLAGTEEVGAISTVKLGSIYNPVEKLLSSGIEDPIEDAKRREIEELRRRYTSESALADLRSRLDDLLATEGIGGAADRAELLKQVDGIIAKQELKVRDRVRDIALLTYASAGRDVVKDLLREGES
jgi:hypothetical protein